MESDDPSDQRDPDELGRAQAHKPAAVVRSPELEQKAHYGVEPEKREKDVAIVAFSPGEPENQERSDGEASGGFVNLRRMNSQ